MQFREPARAKLNLTLSVLGRRPDGYHALESLVAFADIADYVTLAPGRDVRLEVSGAFAAAIEGPNLLERALALLRERAAGLRLGAVALEKNLPVAAGLGGGSADAAALLRAVRRANPDLAGALAWQEIAARLGADVPVCLASRPALMWGFGDRVEPLARPLPPVAAVLVNPRLPLPTAGVFRALAARPAPAECRRPAPVGPFPDLETLVEFMRARGNDLERPAAALLPVIADIKAALASAPGCRLAALSGSGPTCFGIFAGDEEAERAAQGLAAAMPGCWVQPTRIAASVEPGGLSARG
jgi:4-diphosphocytidyl-2-C-methyl-D-erythritol kinase